MLNRIMCILGVRSCESKKPHPQSRELEVAKRHTERMKARLEALKAEGWILTLSVTDKEQQ